MISGQPARRPVALSAFLLAVMIFVAACGGTDPTATSGTTGGGAATTAATGGATTTTARATTAATTGAATTAATTAAPGAGTGATTTRAATATAAAGGTTARATATTPPVAGAATPTRGTATTARGTAAGAAGAATPNTAIAVTGPLQGEAQTLTGTGATFPQVLYSRWFDEYAKATNVRINYQGTGSSAGKRAIIERTADFAGSDSFMTDQELAQARQRCGDTILHVPTALGGIVATYNLPGVNQALKLDGETLAGIFSGDIKRWNAPQIQQLNPGVNLPNQEIIVVHRSDGSGTTDNFTAYLAAVSDKWKNQVGAGSTVNWPTGIGAQGNQGVAGEIKNNPYSIGYVELAYATQQKLPVAQIKNRAGNFVTPTNEAVTNAAEAFIGEAPEDLRFKPINAPGASSYPITGLTYILVCPNQQDQAKAIALSRMLWWTTHEGQQFNEPLDYARIPASWQVKAEQLIRQIKANGQPVFPQAFPNR